jgi:hypothetical protein
VFSQLLPITDNMLEFLVDKENIKEIITVFANQYGIQDELFQNIIKIVDDYVYNESQIIGEPVIEKSDSFEPKVEVEEIIDKTEDMMKEFENSEQYYDSIDK